MAEGLELRAQATQVRRLAAVAVAITAVVCGGAARASTPPDLVVTIAADASPVGEASQDGYTVTITNTTTGDLPVTAVRFLLPGHGTPPPSGDVMGQPKEGSDLAPAFTYVPGSTTGETTADPVQTDRWLVWPGSVVPASSALTLHFLVTTSLAPAKYVSGATVDAPAPTTVLGTAKGAVVEVVCLAGVCLDLEAAPNNVHLGDTVTYTGTLTNYGDDPATIAKFKVSDIAYSTYTPGSTTGPLGGDPTISGHKLLWKTHFVVDAHSSVSFTFSVTATATGVSIAKSRAYFAAALPSGQTFAGSGPTARVEVS